MGKKGGPAVGEPARCRALGAAWGGQSFVKKAGSSGDRAPLSAASSAASGMVSSGASGSGAVSAGSIFGGETGRKPTGGGAIPG